MTKVVIRKWIRDFEISEVIRETEKTVLYRNEKYGGRNAERRLYKTSCDFVCIADSREAAEEMIARFRGRTEGLDETISYHWGKLVEAKAERAEIFREVFGE